MSSALRAILLDMGGVILEMAGTRGFPVERLDWRGPVFETAAVSKDGTRELVFAIMDYLEKQQLGKVAES